MNRTLMRILAVITSFIAYLTVLMGAIVTNTDSGQGCGNSWPFCHGQLIPNSISVAAAIELSHRAISGLDGFCILLLTIWSWWTFRHDFRVKLFGFLSLFFVVVQGALGAMTVAFEGTFAHEGLVSLHFGFSLISFAGVVLLMIRLFHIKGGQQQAAPTSGPISRRLQYLVWGLTAYTYLIVYSGAFVRHSGATLACGNQFPGCGPTLLPSIVSTPRIQMLHRYAANSLWLVVLAFLVIVLRRFQDRRDLVVGASLAFGLITLQALVGISIVLSNGMLVIELLHTTVISIFFAVACYLCNQVGWPWKRAAAAPSEPQVVID